VKKSCRRILREQLAKSCPSVIELCDISGGVKAAIDELLGQIEDASAMPYYELGSKDQRFISTFVIAISGKFTENAREKIVEKMPRGCFGSVYFLDPERITELVERYWQVTRS
jgi:hypothetical protein